MAQHSIYVNRENEDYLQKHLGPATFNAVINALVTQTRLADPDGSIIQQIIRDYIPDLAPTQA